MIVMDNNQIPNNQDNLDSESVETLDSQSDVDSFSNSNQMQNVSPLADNSVTNTSHNNFDSFTGQSTNQNQMPNQFVPQNNGVNNQMQHNAPKKGNGAFVAIVVVLLVVILGLVLFIVFGDKIKSMFGGSEPVPQISDNGGTNNNGNNEGDVVNSASTINVEGFEFEIPQGYVIDNSSNNNLLVDNVNNVGFIPYISANVSYDTVVNKASSVKSILESKGATILDYAEKTFGGKKWLVYKYTNNGESLQHGFTALDSNNTFEVDYINKGNSISDEQAYSVLNKMISSVNNNSGSSFSNDQKGELNPKIADFSKSLLK